MATKGIRRCNRSVRGASRGCTRISTYCDWAEEKGGKSIRPADGRGILLTEKLNQRETIQRARSGNKAANKNGEKEAESLGATKFQIYVV